MSCCETPLIRIEKIKKNQIVNPGSSPYNQMPQPAAGNQERGTLPVQDMTPFVTPNTGTSPGETVVPNPGTGGPGLTPELIPNAPTFTVPANPLLPEGYREILDFNAVQYVNGFYRTQIGRYVRIEQLMGSNTIENKEGYLIGVGINFIILQELSTGNIQVVDIYGIKSMYVYYNYAQRPPVSMPSSMEADTNSEKEPE